MRGAESVPPSSGGILLRDRAQELVDGVRRRKDAVQRWRTVRTLVIDEISMVDAATFDALSAVGAAIRGVDKPFGGIQL